MSDYTPTTEEVELYFKQAVPEPYGQELDDAFDRWLAEVKAQAISDAIAYLKTTPAVTLSGQGGAYELLEAYAQKLEESE